MSMDIQENPTKVPLSENAILHQSGVSFFRIFTAYRKEKKIRTEKIVSGVISRRAFLDIEKGKSVLSRENWKFLMHRIGIVTDYFETVVSRKELKDWRCREDICLSVCEDCKKAKKLLEEYRNSHIKMSNIERQFCLKIEWLLSRNEKSDEELYKLSKDAVCCTVQEDWKENLSVLYVGPEELEAMLLVVWSLLKKNELMDAFRLFDQIQRYPKIHNWEPRMREMICAQIALIGIKLYERMQKIDIGYKIGMESLELLRQQSSQRYAYPLLAELVRIGIMLEKEKSEELLQFQKFQKAFEIVYEENKIPYMRVWQCGSIENSYDVGMVLKRMRMAQEKTQEEVCIDEKGFSFLNVRQLSRMEGKNEIICERISVIVPIYNTEKYLARCIESILCQTYTNLEIILVDDGSTDKSGDICDFYARKDNRVKVVHKENGGAAAARNFALNMVTGQYIGFVDSDDTVEKDFFELLYDLICQYDADISMVAYREIEMGEKIAKLKDKSLIVMNQKQAVKELLFDRKIQNYVWNKLYKRKLFQGVYFPIGVIYEDISVMYDLIRKIEKLVYLPESKYNYYIRKDSIVNTNSHQKRVDELDSVIKRYKDAKRDFPELEQENAYALVMWMIRVYSYTVKENDPNDTFIKEQYELFQSESQKYLCYILTNLKPFKRMILLAMLWDLEKGKEVVRMDGELHE